jgi:hypothetical protein
MNLRISRIKTSAQSRLGHFADLRKKLGFSGHEMRAVNVSNCWLKTILFKIV